MKIDDEAIIKPCFEYNFSKTGYHIVTFLMDNNLESFAYMIKDMINMTSISYTNKMNSHNIKNMEFMFNNYPSLKMVDLSGFNTKNVLNMEYMFDYCYYLESIKLSSFNTKNVKNMRHMFANCVNLKSIDVSSFDTKNVI